ncbi:MAG: DUF4133 domain-containing protein [Muribaculum sp.]|nr:DUF4133 domain-containing protein [Muribaculum sp.]
MNPYEYKFTVFKGLQKPLEFMGLRGRFLTLAGGCIGISFVGGIICMVIIGKLAGLGFLVVSALIGFVMLYIKQKQGLHNKKKCKDILIYHNLFIK